MHKKSYFLPAVEVVPLHMKTEILTWSNINNEATVDPITEDPEYTW